MKKTILKFGTILSILMFISCSNDDGSIIGSGNIITQERTIDLFDKIVTPSSINVNVIYGTAQNISISADDNILKRIETTVNNSTLLIDLTQGNYSNITATVTVTTPDLSELQNSGSGNISFSNFTGLSNIAFTISGSGSIEANGSVTDLSLRMTGSGSFNGYGLIVDNCTLNNSGSGSSEVYCNNKLSGTNSGSGSVYFKGTAIQTINNTGSGNVVNSN